MCGRFVLHHGEASLWEALEIRAMRPGLLPRFNIAPTQPVAVVLQEQDRVLDFFKWGLIPFWAKDPKIGHRMINARAETINEKPAFRAALKRRRCLIPASGYYEWQKTPNGKIPHYLHRSNDRIITLAGLWEEWISHEEEIVRTCTIITTEANDFTSSVHHRMPVILDPPGQSTWLDPSREDPRDLCPLLIPYPGSDLKAYPVSTRVNNARFEDPSCIEPTP